MTFERLKSYVIQEVVDRSFAADILPEDHPCKGADPLTVGICKRDGSFRVDWADC